MYKPLSFNIDLSFLDEDEDSVQCVLTIDYEDGAEAIRTIADDVHLAVSNAIEELFDGGDLGDLFWPLQNEG